MKTLFITIICLFFATVSFAMDVSLEWDSNQDANYYIIHYGTSTGQYTDQTAQIQAPTVSYTFSGLEETTYYFAVKAYNNCGNSSEFSGEVSNGPLPGVVKSVVVKTCVTYEVQ